MKQRIKQVLKILGIAAAVIFILFGIVTWIVFEKKNDWLLSELQKYMNESQSGQLTIASIDLKLFRGFPNITIELEGINYFERWDSVRKSQEQPILHAEQIFVAAELLSLMQEELKISEISISRAQVNIIEYPDNKLNVDLALSLPVKKDSIPAPPASVTKIKPAILVDLESVSLDDILLTWKRYNIDSPTVILLKKADMDVSMDEAGVNLELATQHQIQKLYINDRKLPLEDADIQLSARYTKEIQQLTLLSGEIKYGAFLATVQGTYSLQKNRMLDLQVDASYNDLFLLSRFLKSEVIRQNPNLFKKGHIYLKGRIFGELEKQSPQFNISFGVQKLDMLLPNKLGTFKDIGFDGNFSSGSKADYSQARLQIRNLTGQLPDGYIHGNLSVTNLVDPYLKYNLGAQLKLDGYDQIFQLNSVRDLKGTISMQANFDGPLKLLAGHKVDSSRSSTLVMDNVSFVVSKTNKLVSGLSGKVENRNNRATIHSMTLKYGENDLTLNATIDNLYYSLFNREQEVTASGSLRSQQLYTQDFILDTLTTAQIRDKVTKLAFDFQVSTSTNPINPATLPDITFEIQNLAATFEKMPDIRLVNASGRFSETTSGLKLELNKFHAIMPQGQLDVTGDLIIPKKQNWEFNARVTANNFPWTYVNELVAEIKDDAEPSAKNLPVKAMEIVNANLDLSAKIITFPFDINELHLRNSRISYSPPDSNTISIDKLNLSLDHLTFRHPENAGNLIGLTSTKGTAQFSQLRIPGLDKFDAILNINGQDDRLEILFSRDANAARSEEGKLSIDISKKEPVFHLRLDARKYSLERFIAKYFRRRLMDGDINYVFDVGAAGSSWSKVKQNIKGEIEITGDSLHLFGVDIDDVLKKFRKSQNFNLTDLGAVVIAGPVGLVVTKGSDFASLAKVNLDSTQRTTIQTLLAKWKLDNGKLISQDVAFVTASNRIAFEGTIDFERDSIPGLTIAVVDKNGCSLMDQKLYGKINALQSGKLNVTKTLFGSVINFVHAVVGTNCKPVYTGKVRDPFADQ